MIVGKTKESFQNNNFAYTGEKGETHVTWIENNYINPYVPNTYEITMLYLIRHKGKLSKYIEESVAGLFSKKTWDDIIKNAGFKMETRNSVFIATSLDGFIADEKGGIDWLNSIPNPDHLDMGYGDFISRIDAIVMGRITFETVCSFDIDWPYRIPVFVLSNSMTEIPEKFADKARLVKGTIREILGKIHENGYNRLYIDGGATIQSFLKEDLIDEMILTIVPILLGAGVPLFSGLSNTMEFACTDTKIYLDKLVQNHYKRVN